MAINLNTRYGARFNPGTSSYPSGSMKNRTAEGAQDGSYLEADWLNDQQGFLQALLKSAGLTANDVVDTADASQYLTAARALFNPNLGKNLLINYTFNENQRAKSGTVVLAANEYGHDRMRAGSGGCTYTFAKSGNYTVITITAGTLQQVVEGDAVFGGNHVLSWGGTAQGRINAGSYGTTGAVIESLAAGTNATVEFNTGTLWLPQLEKGSIWTDTQYVSPAENLAACQPYYQKSAVFTMYYGTLTAGASNSRYYYAPRTVAMRGTPTEDGTLSNNTGTVAFGDDPLFISVSATALSAPGNITSIVDYTADAEIYT